ncbi:MAG: hypothetical protein MUF40_06935 [Gemmatimonadaceae bacterium]|jgi:hypothetical protein|nr:hypothetical protein [Gemmatimonadaceae bacterium]
MTRIVRLLAVAAVMAPLAACSTSAPTDPTADGVDARRSPSSRLFLQEGAAAEPAVSFRPRTSGGRTGGGSRR